MLADFATRQRDANTDLIPRFLELVERSLRPKWALVRFGEAVWGREDDEEDSEVLSLTLGEHGVLRLGPKLNGFSYNAQERRLLEVAANQAVIVLENRRLAEERERLRVQELVNAALAAQRGEILSEVLHDLGSDLLCIQLEAALMAEEVGENPHLASIGHSVERIEALLNEKSRLLTGKRAESPAAMLPDGLASALLSLNSQLNGKEQHVVVEVVLPLPDGC